jgi:tripartite-type tricarboxylate transporter receptor subunit TctC
VIGQKLADNFGPQFVIDNRPGANGNIGTEIVVRSPPDGYTLLVATAGILTVNPQLQAKMPYDIQKDLAPVALGAATTNVLIVHPSLPVKTVRDFIRFAQSKPGQMTYASAGVGSASHIAMEVFKSEARIDVLHIPYKGALPGITDLMGGQVQVMLIGLPGALPPIRAGRLKALATTGLTRSTSAPELPTIAEVGVPNFEVVNWFAFLAPAATPKEIVTKLNQEINRALETREVREKLLASALDALGGPPERLAGYIKNETVKAARIVKATGAKAE